MRVFNIITAINNCKYPNIDVCCTKLPVGTVQCRRYGGLCRNKPNTNRAIRLASSKYPDIKRCILRNEESTLKKYIKMFCKSKKY